MSRLGKSRFIRINRSLLWSALGASFLVSCSQKELQDTLPANLPNQGLIADYYQSVPGNRYANLVFSREEADINQDMKGPNGTPSPQLLNDKFGVVWRGYIVPPESGNYWFGLCGNEGGRLSMGGKRLIDQADQATRMWQGSIQLTAGEPVEFELRNYDSGGDWVSRLYYRLGEEIYIDNDDWNGPGDSYSCDSQPNGTSTFNNIVPEAKLVPPYWFMKPDESLAALTEECESDHTFLPASQIPDPAEPTTQQAMNMIRRIVGIPITLFDSRVKEVKAVLDNGTPKQAAVYIINKFPEVYEGTLYAMAARMSTFEEQPDVPLNDFIYTYLSMFKNQRDFREALVGNYMAVADKRVFYADYQVPYNRYNTLVTKQHYEFIESSGIPLKCTISDYPNGAATLPYGWAQKLALPQGGNNPENKDAVATNPEPAGLITGRSYAQAHMTAGTNRRVMEKVFEHFLCTNVEEYRSAPAPLVTWLDVELLPSGPSSHNEYIQECSKCHTKVDNMAKAFGRLHFENDLLKYGPFFLNNSTSWNDMNVRDDEFQFAPDEGSYANYESNPVTFNGGQPSLQGVAKKLAHNATHFLPQARVTDTEYVNYLVDDPVMQAKFGFNPSYRQGTGPQEFGRMVANAAGFGSCMAYRSYREICGINPQSEGFDPVTLSALNSMGTQFRIFGHDMKDLFASVATLCID